MRRIFPAWLMMGMVFLCLGVLILTLPVQAVEILRVQALRSGDIMLDGKEAKLSKLQDRLARIKDAKGQVWFYREGAGSEPTPAQMKAIEMLVAAQVTVSLSTKADFSDYVDSDGKTHPRNCPTAEPDCSTYDVWQPAN